MEKETILSGYCRTIDQHRMVVVVTENGQLLEVDCCYDSCIHTPNCILAQNIQGLLESE